MTTGSMVKERLARTASLAVLLLAFGAFSGCEQGGEPYGLGDDELTMWTGKWVADFGIESTSFHMTMDLLQKDPGSVLQGTYSAAATYDGCTVRGQATISGNVSQNPYNPYVFSLYLSGGKPTTSCSTHRFEWKDRLMCDAKMATSRSYITCGTRNFYRE